MRRPVLHQLLIHRATELGVRFSWQTVVQRIEQIQTKNKQRGTERSLVHTNRHTIRPRYIVGADGHQSRVRSWASLNRSSTSTKRIGLRQHFALDFSTPDRNFHSNYVEVHWSDLGQAYVTPISPYELCVAFVACKKFPSVEHALSHYPRLQHRLRYATPSDEPRGSITLSRRLHRVTHGNVALVGDASGSVDAVTGEGLGLCFRQSLALASALKANDLAQYQRAHLALQRLPQFMARTMLLLDRSPFLRNHALTVLERRPHLFRELLGVHIGHAPLRIFGPNGMIATSVQILAG